jgi:hypothetical protein
MIIERKSTHSRRATRGGCRVERRLARPHRRPSRKPVALEGGRVFFSGRTSRQVGRPGRLDWLAGVAMLLAAASWGVLASLLGS